MGANEKLAATFHPVRAAIVRARHAWVVTISSRRWRMYRVTVLDLATGESYMVRTLTKRGGRLAAARLIVDVEGRDRG